MNERRWLAAKGFRLAMENRFFTQNPHVPDHSERDELNRVNAKLRAEGLPEVRQLADLEYYR